MSILLNETHEDVLLLLCQSNPFLGVVLHNIGQLEIKGVPPQDFLLIGHLEGRLHNASNAGDGAVAPSVSLELHKPQLCIRGSDVTDTSLSEGLLFDEVQNKAVAHRGGIADTLLETDVALQKLHYGDSAIVIACAVNFGSIDFFLFLPQPFQRWRVNRMPFAAGVGIAVLVNQILSLAFSGFEDAASGIFPFHGYTPSW